MRRRFFVLAQEKDIIDTIQYQFESFSEELKNSNQWIDLMDSPMIPMSEKSK